MSNQSQNASSTAATAAAAEVQVEVKAAEEEAKPKPIPVNGGKIPKNYRVIGVIETPEPNSCCPYCYSTAPPLIIDTIAPEAYMLCLICFLISLLTFTFIFCWCLLPLCCMRRTAYICPNCGAELFPSPVYIV